MHTLVKVISISSRNQMLQKSHTSKHVYVFLIVLAISVGLLGCVSAYQSSYESLPDPERHGIAGFAAEACSFEEDNDSVSSSDTTGCAVFSSLVVGTATILHYRKHRVAKEIKKFQEFRFQNGITAPAINLCLKSTGYSRFSTSTVVMPVTSPAFFLADPWECL